MNFGDENDRSQHQYRSCHQHISTPTSVTDIDVTALFMVLVLNPTLGDYQGNSNFMLAKDKSMLVADDGDCNLFKGLVTDSLYWFDVG